MLHDNSGNHNSLHYEKRDGHSTGYIQEESAIMKYFRGGLRLRYLCTVLNTIYILQYFVIGPEYQNGPVIWSSNLSLSLSLKLIINRIPPMWRPLLAEQYKCIYQFEVRKRNVSPSLLHCTLKSKGYGRSGSRVVSTCQ